MPVVQQIVILLFVLLSVDCKISRSLLQEIIKIDNKLVSCKDQMLTQVNFKPYDQVKNNKTSEMFCEAFKALKNVKTCNDVLKKKLLINLRMAAEPMLSCSIDEAAQFELKEFLKDLKFFTKYVYKEMDWNRI